MADFYTNGNDAATHPMIVHELLKKIVVELGNHEFRGGYQKPVISGGVTMMDYVPDSRAEYIQAVESLSDILLPQYDESMTKDYEEYTTGIDKLEEGVKDKDVIMGDEDHAAITKKKLILVKKLFRDLNRLLERTNYLKAKAYTEGMEDDDEDDE